MSNIVCYDSDGNLLDGLYQWDTNQTITVKGVDTSSVPDFHFCNRFSDVALVVTPTLSGGSLTAEIPNILLQQGEPITVFIYQGIGADGYRTIHEVRIVVTPRPKPADYEYKENTVNLSGGYYVPIVSQLDENTMRISFDASLSGMPTVSTRYITLPAGEDGKDGKDGKDGESGKDGRGITSITRTSGNGAAGTTDIYTITYTDNTTSTFSVYNGANGTGSGSSEGGENGATFTPYVDSSGNLSWSNDKGLANPATVNIKGPKGDDGYTPVRGTDYWTDSDQSAIVDAVVARFTNVSEVGA